MQFLTEIALNVTTCWGRGAQRTLAFSLQPEPEVCGVRAAPMRATLPRGPEGRPLGVTHALPHRPSN